MWANAQRDGRPVEYRWRPLFSAAVWLCSNAAKTRPKLTKRSQLLVVRSSPYCKDMWGRYCCLTSFSPIVYTCLSCKDIAYPDKFVHWCADGDFLHHFCVLYFQRAACSTFQTCILNSH